MKRVHIALLGFCLAFLVCDGTSAGDGRDGRPKVRAITAFISLSAANYKKELADTAGALNAAKKKYEQSGWEVETIRITTQPFPEYVRGLSRAKALELLMELDNLAAGNYDFCIGPGMMKDSDDPAMMELEAEFLARAKVTISSASIAGDDGIHWRTIRQAAHLVKYVAENSPQGKANFKFGATAMVGPYGPFYPASYHTGGGGKFAVGLESANVVMRVLSETEGKPEQAAEKLSSELTRYARAAEVVAQDFGKQSGWEYVGLDPTPAPLGDVSIGAAMEGYMGHPVGGSGTLSTAFLITTAVRSVKVKQVGYAGLMLPVLEDKILAKRWSEGRLSIDALLSYSSVCATGLDVVPLPGDVTEEQIARILGDVAALASKWKKPLTARLLPVRDKHAGETSEFDDPYLTNAKIQALP